jgi:hypothetical protein
MFAIIANTVMAFLIPAWVYRRRSSCSASRRSLSCVKNVGHETRQITTFLRQVLSSPNIPDQPSQYCTVTARTPFPDVSLADLYDVLAMPPQLTKAHAVLDRAVDRCYRPQPFPNERKRVEYLFNLYDQLDVSPFVHALLNEPFNLDADINGDGVVTGLDVDPFVAVLLGANAGSTQQIPEPSTQLLTIVALGVVGWWRQRKHSVRT